jgi:hypothetical protein
LQEPVQTLCARLRAELASLDASHPALSLMTDIHTADRLEDAIAEVRAIRLAQPAQSATVEQLQREYYHKLQRRHRAWLASASSLATDQFGRGSPSTTHSEGLSNQIPGGFERRTARAVQDSRPVRTREFTKVVD